MFWNTITKLILKNKLAWLVLLGLCTAFMGYMASKVETSYEFAKLMPETDSVSIEYNMLVEEFGQASNTIVIAMEDPDFFKRKHLEEWLGLVDSLKLVDGITDVQSLTEAYGLEVDTITEKLKPFVPTYLKDGQQLLDDLKKTDPTTECNPFHRGRQFDVQQQRHRPRSESAVLVA